MTEEMLDADRPLAAVADEETSRLVRSLKGSNAHEPTVIEHASLAFYALEGILARHGLLKRNSELRAENERLNGLVFICEQRAEAAEAALKALADKPKPEVIAEAPRNRKK